MQKKRVLVRLLPALAVAGVLGASILASPAQIIGALSGYGYSFGGILKGGQAVAGTATTEEVFVRGQDNALWSSTVNGNAFGGWTSRGGLTVAPPGATSTSATNTDAFVEGVDAALWQTKETSGTFAPFAKIGGVLTAGPGATNGFAAGREDVFVRGGDRAVWWTTSADSGATWTTPPGTAAGKFSSVGGVSVDSIAAVSQTGTIDIFVWGQDNAVWWNHFPLAGGWAGWTSLGGQTIDAAGASSCSAGHMDVWVVGVDGQLWSRSTTNSGTTWGAWTQWGGQWTSNLTAFCHPGTHNVDVFGRGTDNALWRFAVTGA